MAGVALVVLLVLSISQGAFTTWGQWDYIGWWVLLPLAVLLPVSLVTYLARAWGKRD